MESKTSVVLSQFGAVLRKRRFELDLTQEALASKIGIDRTYISGLERGRRNPTLLILVRVAAALDISVSELLDNIP